MTWCVRPPLVPLALLLLAACDAAGPARSALEAGETARAVGLFEEVVAASHEPVPAELTYDLALAAFADGRLDRAAEVLERMGDGELAPEAAFLAGSVAAARAELALRQAQAVEAEPFAFDLAVRRAERAVEHFVRAASSRDDWPAARRNAERAVARLEEMRALRDEAADRRSERTRTPEVRLRPASPDDTAAADGAGGDQDPSGADGDATDEAAAGEGSAAELDAAGVLGLLERLDAKEQEKRRLREAGRRARRSPGDRDW